jgi:WD40 repeat protein
MIPLQAPQPVRPLGLITIDENKVSNVSVGSLKGRPVTVVKFAHLDDIHTILKLKDGTFITGSKDGALKKWDFQGKLVADVFIPPYVNYKSWITALAPLGHDRWLSGTRDGYVHLWDLKGKQLQEINAKPIASKQAVCKERNLSRVNCLVDYTQFSSAPRFLTGWAKQFTLHPQHLKFQREAFCFTSDNDWVYSIVPLAPRRFLTITGCRLDIFSHEPRSFAKWYSDSLIGEPADPATRQRYFISAVVPMVGNVAQFGLSIFNGTISVLDIQAKKYVFRAQEHQNRVWMIENLRPSCFASCADDGLIKIWDLRAQAKSTATLQDNLEESARVSVLSSLAEYQFVSGSCPDKLDQTEDRARLSFWDLRKL